MEVRRVAAGGGQEWGVKAFMEREVLTYSSHYLNPK